jgi:deferrochelatase/peroxidase EfeB
MKPIDRRDFLTRSGLLAGAAGIGGVGALVRGGDNEQGSTATPTSSGTDGSVPSAAEQWAVAQAQLAQREQFSGTHQAGILTAKPAQATFAALDSIAPSRAVLEATLRALSIRAGELTTGGPITLLEPDAPPTDSGILGPVNAPDALTVTIAFGASLFDQRYGLAGQRPHELVQMPTFPIDNLNPAESHGDVLLQICANQRDTVAHTLRELLRTVHGSLQLRWNLDGFSAAARGPTPKNNTRNLFAFRDGTANPPTSDAAMMNELVWAGAEEPAWAAGGTYQVVRIIRQHVEFWDRVGLSEQEELIGRVRSTGAPLGGTSEFEDPSYDLDPDGKRIPLTAHIRLANPRTTQTADQRILRRGYNFTRGFDAAGELDQGLIFVAFNQSPERQFATIQTRLVEEPMIDYITPVGGGYFFVPPGTGGNASWIGEGLFAARS